MKKMIKYVYMLLLCCLIIGTNAWDSEELEIFDLVEEINKNFYEFMQISPNASSSEIKRAFRSLSIVLHPDKSSAADANIQFRNLVSIYEVLKDSSKREKYDKVLRDGLPNWKSALYYYRRMRKIGLYEGALIVFIIITIGQYIFAWAAYLEKKYTAEQVFGSKLKKLQKKHKGIDIETILSEIPSPSILNTLPFQIPLAIWNLPKTIKEGIYQANQLKEQALEKRRLEIEEARLQEELEREAEEQVRLRKEKKEFLRKRKQNAKAPEKTDDDLRGYSQIQARENNKNDAIKPVSQKNTLSGGFWTDEDLAELIRLVKKYPSGAGSRWNTIAETMNRSVQEVTFMAAKMKENGYRVPGQTDSIAENLVQHTQEQVKKEKVKRSSDKIICLPETNWSQEQQRALEAAITKYRKTGSGDRWQKIANCVPDKTKEECLVRYKYLCDLVQSQKQAEEADKNNVDEADKLPSNENQENFVINETITTTTTHSTIEDVDDDNQNNELIEKVTSKKRNKRQERRRRKKHNLSSDDDDNDNDDDDDSDNAYQYEMN